MKRTATWLLGLGLAVSVLFNVFFLAGYAGSTAELKRLGAPGQAVGLVADELSLDDTQTEAFARLRSEMADDAAVLQSGLTLASRELFDELLLDEPDGDRIASILEREAELRRQWRRARSARVRELLESLQPEQRARLSGRMARHRDRDRHHRHLLRRFDTNRDGHLDTDERAAAEEAVQTHCRRFERRWRGRFGDGGPGDREGRQPRDRWSERVIEQFDTDGDGSIDDDECQAMRQWFDGRRGRRR